MKNNNLIFGTAKMGLPNYANNNVNRLLKDSNSDILDFLHENGILKLDSAERYGDSHNLIGIFNQNKNKCFSVSTKVDNLIANDKNASKRLQKFAHTTINMLNVDKLDILYLHQNDTKIINDPYILEGIEELKSRNLINNSGISIYTEEELVLGLEKESFDYIQIPVSLYDSFLYDKILSQYNGSKVKFIGRSIFFRGFLFNQKSLYLKKFPDHHIFDEINRTINQMEIDLTDLTLSFLHQKSKLDSFIFSSSSIKDIEKILNFKSKEKLQIPFKLLELSSQFKSWSDLRLH